jgi:hypothetical protein
MHLSTRIRDSSVDQDLSLIQIRNAHQAIGSLQMGKGWHLFP